MTHVQKLNRAYKLIQDDFTSQKSWNDLDLILLDLKYKGYSFRIERKYFKGTFKVRFKSRKAIQSSVQKQISVAVNLQLYDYLKSLLDYRKENLSKILKVKRVYRVYDSDYISVKGKVINVRYSYHSYINLRLDALLNRRLKHTCENNKKS